MVQTAAVNEELAGDKKVDSETVCKRRIICFQLMTDKMFYGVLLFKNLQAVDRRQKVKKPENKANSTTRSVS